VAVAAWHTERLRFGVRVGWQSFDQRPLLVLEWTVVAAAAVVAVDPRTRLVLWKSGVAAAVVAGVAAVVGVVAAGVNWCHGYSRTQLI